MALITTDIPDAILPRVIDSLSYGRGYSDMIPDPSSPGDLIPNPVTKAQYAKEQLKEFLRSNMKSYEAQLAGLAAIEAKEDEIDTVIDPITVT